MSAGRAKLIFKVTAAAVALAAPFEGLRRVAYYDPPGVLTVCYGHTGNVIKNKVYTVQECKALLEADMAQAVAQVEQCQPGLPGPVLLAFSDAVFNIGPRVACDQTASTAARLLAARRYADACRELPKWSKARVAGQLVTLPGLVKRREAEMNVCLGGVV